MTRTVPEWIGKSDDEAIPPRVKVRVFDNGGGLCARCGLSIRGKLRPAYDHIVALINGGQNRESNLQLLCDACHRVKTGQDVAEKATTYRKRIKAIGIKKKKRTIPGRRFDGTPIPPKWK